MTIYVDPAVRPYRRMLMCHMMTDGDIQELHDMAARLGLSRTWFQNKTGHPHYDICKSKRAEAIRLGARPVSSIELVRRCSTFLREQPHA